MMRLGASRVALIATAAWAFLMGGTIDAFSPLPQFHMRSLFPSRSQHHHRQHLATHLGFSSSSDNSDVEKGSWTSPNDFRTFLTQCSIQSFMFLLRSLRDPQTVLWLEEFSRPAIARSTADHMEDESNYETGKFVEPEEPKKTATLLRYHGLAAINTTLFPTWEDYFRELLKEPTVTYSVESKQAHIPNYDLDIDPASLCSRILSVREQIAREFSHDLGVVANMGGHTLQSYWENLKSLRSQESDGGNVTVAGIDRQNLLFLEFSPTPDNDYAPSPLRKGNFDLLVLLATQESIHRVLNDESRREGAERATNEFLTSFYKERLISHFTGSQRYGRADDFLEELLLSSPRMIELEDGVTTLIDPMRIAEIILQEREKVALEWKEVATESPKEHMDIRRLQLNRMMGICEDEDEDVCTDWQ